MLVSPMININMCSINVLGSIHSDDYRPVSIQLQRQPVSCITIGVASLFTGFVR